VASKNRSGSGSDSTHWRIGFAGNTSSASNAALSVIRRAPHEGQKPRLIGPVSDCPNGFAADIKCLMRTIRGQDGYFGDSLGGLFGMFVLLNEPDTFGRYILGSPSLWWDDGLMLKQAEQFAAAGNRVDARLFMSVGGRESKAMISGVEQMARLLAGVDGLEIGTQVIPDESHMSVLSINYVRGVQWAYQTAEPYFLDAYRESHPDR
jgi:hypothetical protein